MNLKFIERLIELVARSTVAELTYSSGDSRIRLGRHGLDHSVAPQTVSVAPQQDALIPVLTAPSDKAAHTVSSGLAGVFYRSASPDKPPFVEVGDVIEEGQTLAIVEAMKMLNPIEADRRGRILAILVNDGVMIEAGSPLFTLEAMDDHA